MPEGTKIGTLYIDLELNKGPYKQGLNQTQTELNAFKRSAAQAFGGDLSKGTRTWSSSLADANKQLFFLAGGAKAVTGAFTQVFGTAREWANVGLGAMRSEMALDKLSGSAQEADKWINAIRKSTLMTVTEGEAAAQAYNLMAFGLAHSSEEAGRFARDIAIVAQARPQLGGVENAISQIQLTLANTSFMRLDQLGLSSTTVRKRMEELQAQTAGLSREQAFNQAVMEGLHTQANTLGDDFLAVGSNMAQMEAQARQFKENVGKRIAEGFEGAAKAGLSLIEIWKYFETHPLKLNLEMGGRDILDWDYAKSKFEVLGQQINRGQIETLASGLLGNVGGQAAAGIIMPPENLRYQYAEAKRQEALRNRTYLLPPALQNYAGSMAQNYAFAHPALSNLQIEAPEYDSQWAPGMATQYGTGRAQGSALASLQAPFFMGRQTRMAGAFGLSEIQQQMEWIEKGQGGEIVAQFFGAIETGARGATSQIQAGTGALQSMVQTAESISFDSLEEKFGIDPRAFDVDVLNEMRSALGDAGVETDVASEAMKRYELQIGAATGSSEVFAGQMDTLAANLRDGKISADEYVDSVTRLSQTDMSWIDRLTGQAISEGDIDRAQRYIEIVSGLSQQSLQPYVTSADFGEGTEMMGPAGAPGMAGVMPAATPLGTMKSEMDELTQKFASAETDWTAPVDTALGQNELYFDEFMVTSIDKITAVNDAFLALEGTSVNLNANINMKYQFGPNPPAGPAGTPETGPINLPPVYTPTSGKPGGLPEFHDGAYTGASGADFLAWLRADEYVVPGSAARGAMRGGDNGGGTIINQVLVAGRVTYEETIREQDRRNRGPRSRDYRR